MVPITPALGMLAFVGRTRPLLDVISPDLVDASGAANDSFYAGVHVRAAPILLVLTTLQSQLE